MRINKISTTKPLSILGFIFAVSTLILSCVIATDSRAASLDKWDPGRIIDDRVFTNSNSMSVADIDTFLKSKVSSCDTWGTQPSEFGGGTRAQWAASRGIQPPFTCLKDYSESGKSSAQIIYDVSREFTINPQVLIVLLQKEQGLVTDTWPTSTQYRTATGYGCPDSTPGVCDGSYYGFTNQLRWAGRMFRAIMNNSPTWYTPYILGNNYIQYNPDTACGGSNVNIQNRSTQALYNYTPYQPNQAALSAGYGTASCGAYGNRNFYLYFTDWFGNISGNQFEWSQESISFYYNKEKTLPADANSLPPNSRVYVSLRAKNIGWAWWANHGTNPVLLGTANPNERNSATCTEDWITCSRATSLAEYAIAPGQVGTFNFWIKTEASPGSHTEYFNLLAENMSWMQGSGLNLTYRTNAQYSWDFISRDSYTDSTKTSTIDTGAVVAGTRFYQVVKAKNTGNTIWKNTGSNPIILAPNDPNERKSEFCDITWIACNRTVTSKESTVAPGETATFEYYMSTPNRASQFYDKYTLLIEGITWLNNLGTYTSVKSISPIYTWEPTSYKFTTTDTNDALSYLQHSTTHKLHVVVKNTGNITWNKGVINLATINPRDRKGQLWHPSWLSNSRLATFNENSVKPGEYATFTPTVNAPSNFPSKIAESLGLVAEGVTWMPDTGLVANTVVADKEYSWQYAGQYEYTDATGARRADTQNMTRSTDYFITVKARNTGANTWYKNKIYTTPVNPIDRISTVQHPSWVSSTRAGTLLEDEIKPGQTGTIGFWIKTPSSPVSLDESFELITDTGVRLNTLGLHYKLIVR